jgi:hypothetical protein
MIDNSHIADGPRWIEVAPKGYAESVGDFLATIGLASPDTQAMAIVAFMFISWLALKLGNRMGNRSDAKAARLPKAAAGPSGGTHRYSDGTPDPNHKVMLGFRRGRESAAVPGAKRGVAPGCAWQQMATTNAAGLKAWVCAVCGQTAYSADPAPPKECRRAVLQDA